jgi:hypothetical protein
MPPEDAKQPENNAKADFLEALSQPKSPEECVLSEPYGEAEDAHHVSCFSFIFKKKN